MAWSVLAAELAKAGNKVLEHKLKPAIEKMRDFRFGNLKKWNKWKKKSDESQAERKKRVDKLR